MKTQVIPPLASLFCSTLKISRQKSYFSALIIAVFKLPFNIFGFDFLKTNFRIIVLGHKLSDKMLKNILASVCLVLFLSALHGQENRSFSGYGNNLENKNWGAAHSPVLRMSSVNYSDGMGAINNTNLPDPRTISNTLFEQKEMIVDEHQLSDYIWVFGQFIDHDITLVEGNPAETVLLSIPPDDEYFLDSDFIITSRNKTLSGTGNSPSNPRQYANEISAFIDGSAIYGSDEDRASWLRTFNDGKLKSSENNLLPWNTFSGEYSDDIDPTAPVMADDTRQLTKYFVAGDVRANENPLLIGIQTIFLREHNRLCDVLKEDHPNWNDEQLYQRARKLVGAYIQNICFYEWLPAMGIVLPEYRSYSDQMNPGIFNVFSAAAFRIGHTLINSDLLRMDNSGNEIMEGSIRLQDAFFNPFAVVHAGGIDPYFKGMGIQVMQKLDCKVIGDLRNFLFGAPGSGGLDLASINIFRGRDRGLAGYNQLRGDFGLPKVKSYNDFVANPEDAFALEELYGNIENIDAWVGMLAERHKSNAIFGELVMRIIEDQFQILRDGDRFYFENDPAFTPSQIEQIKKTKLYDVVMRNSELSVMQKNLFIAMPHNSIPEGPIISEGVLAAAVFPNPAYDNTTIKVVSEEDTTVKISLFNSNGQLMKTVQKSVITGKNFINMDLETFWPRGYYNILIESDNAYSIIKLIKE